MQTIRAYIDRHARRCGEQTFLIAADSGVELSFGRLKVEVDRIGAELDRMGLPAGARVAFLLDNSVWTALLFFGVMANNRVIVPLNAVAGRVQLQHVLAHSDVQTVLVSEQYAARVDELMAAVGRPIRVVRADPATGPAWPVDAAAGPACAAAPQAQSTALLLYTSGSTGLPKGALLSHRAVVSGGRNVAGGHALSSADRALCVLPVYHINGAMVTLAAPLVSGSSVVMPARFSAGAFWPLVAQYQCTWSSVVPTMIKYLLDRAAQEPFRFGDDARLTCFRFGRSASAPLAAVTLRQWEETFRVPMIETIGLTETAGTVATNPMPPAVRKPGSVGLPFGNQIRVVDEHDRDCPPRVTGELLIRGDNLLDGYYKNPTATAAAFAGEWFRTGDLGLQDEAGYLFITGRLKELIIRGGENIAPREIDDVLYQHEAVLEAAAVGVDDAAYGQEVVACVVVRVGYRCSQQELQDFCRAAVGEVKAPKRIYFMADLPKGPSGKILRLQLPTLIAALQAGGNQRR